MVDSRKSAQAKQQRRNRDGTYADEGKTSSMPTGDVLERFEQNQQSNTGGAPVETYETGVKRMQELDQKLIDIANREYSERKFGPDDEGFELLASDQVAQPTVTPTLTLGLRQGLLAVGDRRPGLTQGELESFLVDDKQHLITGYRLVVAHIHLFDQA